MEPKQNVFASIDAKLDFINSLPKPDRIRFCKKYLKDKLTLSTFELDFVEFLRNQHGIKIQIEDNGSVTVEFKNITENFERFEDAIDTIVRTMRKAYKSVCEKYGVSEEEYTDQEGDKKFGFTFQKTVNKVVYADSEEEAVKVMNDLDPEYCLVND